MNKNELDIQHDREETQEYHRNVSYELSSTRVANKSQAEDATVLQRKLIYCTLAVAIGVGLLVIAKASELMTTVPVSVTVVDNAKLEIAYHALDLNITQSDISRGYVDAPSALRFSVLTNSKYGFLMNFYPVGDIFKSAQVDGIVGNINIDEAGGSIVHRGVFPQNVKYELNFRFILRPNLSPGRYAWPLQISVQALI